MRGRDAWIYLALATILDGCVGGPPAPHDFLPNPEAARQDGFGGWVVIHHGPKDSARVVEGELVAVGPDSTWVLGARGPMAVAIRSMREAKVWGYDPGVSGVHGLTLLGTLSTISNGMFLVATAPMWIIGGNIAAAGQAKGGRVQLKHGWQALRRYARFPQGLPPGVRLADLRPKPTLAREKS